MFQDPNAWDSALYEDVTSLGGNLLTRQSVKETTTLGCLEPRKEAVTQRVSPLINGGGVSVHDCGDDWVVMRRVWGSVNFWAVASRGRDSAEVSWVDCGVPSFCEGSAQGE